MSRQGDVAAALVSTLGIDPSEAARMAEVAEIETIRARTEIARGTLVARGALKLVLGRDLVIDVTRAPQLVLDAPWKYVTLRASLVVPLEPELLETRTSAIAAAHAATAASLASRIEARAAPTIEARIDRLLADLAKRHGTRLSGGIFLALPLRGRDVASLVGTTIESVSRVFADWKREGRIRATRDGIWLRS